MKKPEQELRKHGTVYSVDEFCTSKKCNRCKSNLYNERKFVTGKDGRRYDVKVHSVLHCHNSVCKSMTVDRDISALSSFHATSRDYAACVSVRGSRCW